MRPLLPSAPMKLVFLDIDGVLNSEPFLRALAPAPEQLAVLESDLWPRMIDPVLVARLETLVTRTQARVVISSSWRHGRSLPWFARVLRDRGFTGEIVGITADFEESGDPRSKRLYSRRGDEIKAWLEGWGEHVESFVVLDDTPDMDAVRDRFVHTSADDGLTDADVDAAVAILERAVGE